MPFGGPGRQILAQDGVEVGARVAGIVEVLGERGQIRVGLGGHAVAVDDDRPPIREDSEDLGGVDVRAALIWDCCFQITPPTAPTTARMIRGNAEMR